MCCTESAVEFLKREGKTDNVFFVGDPMYDAFKFYEKKVGNTPPEKLVSLNGDIVELPKTYYYMTCHREENAGREEILFEILSAMDSLDSPCIFPVHPRNRKILDNLKRKYKFENVVTCEPVGYLMSVFLTQHAIKIVTDSGGLQREAFFARKQCVTVFDHVAWPETMVDNRNQLAKPEKEDILSKLTKKMRICTDANPFGDGTAAEKIVDTISKFCMENEDALI